VLAKEGRYEAARKQLEEAAKLLGPQPELLYNIALCHYRQKQFAPALKALGEVIERGVREHPELSVGSATEGLEVRSVGNSQVGARCLGNSWTVRCVRSDLAGPRRRCTALRCAQAAAVAPGAPRLPWQRRRLPQQPPPDA
jgi:hypothetical protein